MSEEDTTALVPDEAPATEAAPTEAPAPDPFEKRYNDLRSDYDRRNSLLDQARQGNVDAIRELGFEVDLPEEDPTPQYEDDPVAAQLSPLQQQVEELNAWRQQQEAERIAGSIRSHVDQLAQANEVTLTDADKEYIFGRAVAGEKIDQTTTEAAFKAHTEYLASQRSRFEEEYIPTKRASRPGSGQATTKQPDLDNPQERVAYMQSLLEGNQAA